MNHPLIGTWDAPEPPRTSNKTGPATSERGNDMQQIIETTEYQKVLDLISSKTLDAKSDGISEETYISNLELRMKRLKTDAHVTGKNDMQRKLTPADIEAAIKSVEYSQMGQKTSVCLVTLVNGYELIGVSSCVDPANFDPQIGNDLALKKAKDQIWMLEGYVLQNKLANNSHPQA